MIGIMNNNSEAIEFYSAREENRVRKQESLEQTQAFTETKRKPLITYSLDGLRLIDGKPDQIIDGVALWQKVIRRKAFSPTEDVMDYVEVIDDEKQNGEEETEMNYVTTIWIEDEDDSAASSDGDSQQS